jgi:hypothetical protein
VCLWVYSGVGWGEVVGGGVFTPVKDHGSMTPTQHDMHVSMGLLMDITRAGHKALSRRAQ